MSIWSLTYEHFDPDREPLREALCTLGNGYFATRGAAPETQAATDVHYPGTYVAGCYNRLKTDIAGRTIENEDMVNVPNWLVLTFRIEGGEWFDLSQATVHEYRQELNLRRGILTRFIRFSDSKGRRTQVAQRRFVHMADPHLSGLEIKVTPENWSGNLELRSALDGQVTNSGVRRYRQLNNKHLTPIDAYPVDKETICLRVETVQSRISIAQAARTRVFGQEQILSVERRTIQKPGYIAHEFSVPVEEARAITVEKLVALYTSRDRAISECGADASKRVRRVAGFDSLLERHVLAWDHLWRRCRLDIKNDARSAMILYLHVFHLLQTVSINTIDLDTGVPARGLHGEAYRGHVFWDELFIFPFLNLRRPDVTRSLLLYRYRRLPEARRMARQAGYEGAMYPWQSGSNGREESQMVHLNPRSSRWIPDKSHVQRHINIAIAYNIWDYYQVTADIDFLSFYGAEMILEIARFWASIAEYNRSLNRYEIKGVMGPDEYHDGYPGTEEPGVDNNAYTNVMAVWVLCRALEVLETISEYRRQSLMENLSLKPEELGRWEDITRRMKVPFHNNDIISQFEGYEDMVEFDWQGYQKKYGDIQRLDRILEVEGDTPNRYKLSKQADVLMLFYLLSSDELAQLFHRLGYNFDSETIPRNIDYYVQRTSHGSTLSRVVHAWVMARSSRELSWHLFQQALESDVSDIQGGTTAEGIHLGAMAGSVDLIQRCYTGIETRENTLWLNPSLPEDLDQLEFNITYRNHWIDVRITQDHVRLNMRMRDASPINIGLKGEVVECRPGETRELAL